MQGVFPLYDYLSFCSTFAMLSILSLIFQTVLAQTQDKALARIEKLRNEKKALGERLREIEENRGNSSPASFRLFVLVLYRFKKTVVG